MYAVIFWRGDDYCYPLTNGDSTLKLFDELREADKIASIMEADNNETETRVISIEGVRE